MSKPESQPSSQRQQVAFRLENDLFLDFKRKLIDDGNKKVQEVLEVMVRRYVDGEITI